jgi:hypothetical protein
MSQSIHFSRLKYFSEEFTKAHNYDEILQELKKILKEEKKIDETQEKIIEDIEIQYLTLSAYTSEIEKFLTTGSEIKLHPKSRYYFVNEKMWPVLQEEIFKQSQDIKNAKDFFDLVKDCTEIEGYYSKKMLVFEAS